MIRHFRSSAKDEAGTIERVVREALATSLEVAVAAFKASGERGSQRLQNFMKKEVSMSNVRFKADFSGDEIDSLSNYRVDLHGWSESGSEVTSQWVLEFAFDNRQAIPTNVIKCDLALSRFKPSLKSENDFSFLVTFCEESRDLCNWDSSVGSFEEYVYSLENGYSDYLRYPCNVFGIRA